MKKFKVIGLVSLMLVFGLMSMGSGSSSSDKKDITSSGTTSSDSSSSDSLSDTSDDSASAGANQSSETPTIEEQVLIDDNGLKITATEYVVDSIWGDGIKLLIENDGSSDVGIGCTALIVNDYMVTDLFSSTVSTGKKDYETLNLYSSDLKAAGIDNVGKVEIYFYTYDPDSYMTVKNYDCVTIKTSEYDSMDTTPNDEGQELYNAGGIRIVGKYVDENSFWGTGVQLYIENTCGKNKIIQCDDMSINGFMVTPYFSSTVYDGKKAITEITILSSDLEENNITSVDEIELKFKIIDENFMNSIETDAITFSTK